MEGQERSRIRVVEMDIPRGLLGVRRMDRVLNAWIRELCRVMKRIDKRINEGVLWWFGHVYRMENNMIPKRVYVGVCW